jgi:hypothetical protein
MNCRKLFTFHVTVITSVLFLVFWRWYICLYSGGLKIINMATELTSKLCLKTANIIYQWISPLWIAICTSALFYEIHSMDFITARKETAPYSRHSPGFPCVVTLFVSAWCSSLILIRKTAVLKKMPHTYGDSLRGTGSACHLNKFICSLDRNMQP